MAGMVWIPLVVNSATRFEELCGLCVQPAKSVLFFPNTADAITDYEGAPELQHGHKTR